MARTSLGPDVADETSARNARATATSRWPMAMGIAGLVVVLWVGNNLFDTITGSVPGGNAPPGQEPAVQPNDPNGPSPGGGEPGAHDPSRFDHE